MRKIVVFISIDTLRFDCCGYAADNYWLKKYGVDPLLKVDTLREMAGKSACFTNCFSTSTYTTNSHASLLTGLYPPHHGVRAFFKHRLKRDIPTLTSILKGYGYRTILMSDNPALFMYTGLDAGFDTVYTDEIKALEDIRKDPGSDIFAFFHFFDVHDPYLFSHNPVTRNYNQAYFDLLRDACKKQGITFYRQDHYRSYYELFYALKGDVEFFFPLYTRGVSEFDAGRFRRFIRLAEKAADLSDGGTIVLFSDHGEGRVDDHDPAMFRHEGLPYDDVVRVPLMIRHPDIRPTIRDDLRSLVDVVPSVLDLLEIPLPSQVSAPDGVGMQSRRESIYAEHWMRTGRPLFSSFSKETMLRQRIVRTAERKYILNGTPECIRDQGGLSDEERSLIAAGIGDVDTPWYDKEKEYQCVSKEEQKIKHWLGVVDLIEDPYERSPRDPADADAAHVRKDLTGSLRAIYILEREAVVTEQISFGGMLNKRIGSILKKEKDKRIIIYGAGEHTRHLLEETSIGKADIVAIVDSDPEKWGREIQGIAIISPDDALRKRPEAVIISSHDFQDEIYRSLVKRLEWSKVTIYRLYDDSDRKNEEAEIASNLKSLGYL